MIWLESICDSNCPLNSSKSYKKQQYLQEMNSQCHNKIWIRNINESEEELEIKEKLESFGPLESFVCKPVHQFNTKHVVAQFKDYESKLKILKAGNANIKGAEIFEESICYKCYDNFKDRHPLSKCPNIQKKEEEKPKPNSFSPQKDQEPRKNQEISKNIQKQQKLKEQIKVQHVGQGQDSRQTEKKVPKISPGPIKHTKSFQEKPTEQKKQKIEEKTVGKSKEKDETNKQRENNRQERQKNEKRIKQAEKEFEEEQKEYQNINSCPSLSKNIYKERPNFQQEFQSRLKEVFHKIP